MNGISALLKGLQKDPSPLPLCEDKARKEQSMNQEAGPHQTLNLLLPLLETSSLQNCEK